MRTIIDDATKCVHLELRNGTTVRTVERDGGTIALDLGRNNKLLGIEILDPKASQNALMRIAKEFKVPQILTFDPSWTFKQRYQRLLIKRDRPCVGTRMYVLINKSILTTIQCGVQAAHAVASFMDLGKTVPVMQRTWRWARKYKTLIFLDCNEKQEKYLRKHSGLAYQRFKEPDLGGRWTATAFEPVDRVTGGRIFGHLRRV